jgi:hypothetical protein
MAERRFGQKHFASFSGADIRAAFGNKEIGELQAFSYAIQREKAPIYTMGHKNPRAFSRGKRGIAGTLVFVMFDSHVLLSEMGVLSNDVNPQFLSTKDEYRPTPPTGSTGIVNDIGVGPSTTLVGDVGDLLTDDGTGGGDITFDNTYELHKAWFVDQIPPFDITVTAANEYGAAMYMRVIGVELLNEGYGISVDDIVSEQQTTYVCRTLSPWQAYEKWQMSTSGSQLTVS